MENLKIFLSIVLGLASATSYTQLYVGSNAYLYAKDQVLFVNQGIDLQEDGHIYLRNESQLIQGTASTSTNSGLGTVSLYQEGTTDNFEYNFWCAPVGMPDAATGNSAFGIGLLSRPTTPTESTAALFPNDLDGTALPLQIAKAWIYKYLSSDVLNGWISVQDSPTILPGEGFTMKGTAGTDNLIIEDNGVPNNAGSGQRYDFRGKPNDGNILVNVGEEQFTLTGNPYPSALHVNAFLLDPDNFASNGIAYYWEQDKSVNSHVLTNYKGGYGTYSPISLLSNGLYVPASFDSYNADGSLNTTGTSSGLNIERKYAPIGQGFKVKGTQDGTLTLKNAHRTYYKESLAYSQLERNSTVTVDENAIPAVSHIKINTVLNHQSTRQMALAFVPAATDGIDFGIDAKSPASQDLPADAYFILENDKYVIQGLEFEVEKRIPIGLQCSNPTSFQLYVADVINFNNNQMVYMYDDWDGSYHNIKTSTFEITLPSGIYNDRFEITFTNTPLNTAKFDKGNFIIAQDNNQQMLSIYNPNQLEISQVGLYDITGKLLQHPNIVGTENKYELSTSGLSTAVYIIEIKTAEAGTTSQKIMISN